MSQASPEKGRVLVLHRQELADVCNQLDDLGIPYEERAHAPSSASDGGPWRVVVATPQRVLELRSSRGVADGASHIAVCDGFSRTLSKRLTQARVDFLLRRPVHPGALRLLLLHAWYRGPEKRRVPRVSIGAPVRVRARLGFARDAMLLELSATGCRLQLDQLVKTDARLSLTLPAELTGGRAVKLKGRVARSAAAAVEDATRGHEVAVQFEALSRGAMSEVKKLVAQHGTGPAPWKDAPRTAAPERPRSEPEANETTQPGRDAENDRRQSPRRRYAKPVLVKGDGSSRILMGQDLSSGGMRVMRDESLEVGAELKLALYGEDGVPPLMLNATVAREDGAFLVLIFADLGEEGREQIARFMSRSPVTAAEDGDGTAIVVSEIVEQA